MILHSSWIHSLDSVLKSKSPIRNDLRVQISNSFGDPNVFHFEPPLSFLFQSDNIFIKPVFLKCYIFPINLIRIQYTWLQAKSKISSRQPHSG